MTYKDLCGNEKRVWIELGEKRKDIVDTMRFLKELGCKWSSGAEINPRQEVGPYISVHCDGTIAYVGMWSWVAWHKKSEEERTKIISWQDLKQMR